jgi:hypothetical protein
MSRGHAPSRGRSEPSRGLPPVRAADEDAGDGKHTEQFKRFDGPLGASFTMRRKIVPSSTFALIGTGTV